MEKKAIVSAAKELNRVMGLEPKIDVKADVEEIKTLILEAAEFLNDDDDVSDETRDLIAELKEDADSDDEPEEKPVKVEKKAEKAEKAEKKGAGNKSPIKRIGDSFTRAAAAAAVLRDMKGPLTVAELVEKADAVYAKKGGTSNPKEARWASTIVLQAMIEYGAMAYDGTTITKKA